MKEIPVKQFTEKDTTVSLLLSCLENGGNEGVDYAGQKARARVFDVIEKLKNGDIIKLEDADHETAKACVRSVRWIKFERHLVQFSEQFLA